MGIKAHYLNDPDGNKFYPYAHADATFDRNGEKVGTRLDNADAEIEELKKRTNTAVQSVKIGDVEYKNGTDVVLPEYPTTLPASDVYDWAKQPTKPSYTKDEITGLGNVENKSSETIRSEITKSNVTKALGYTPYTPNEVDNKLSALETNIDWKEAVGTFNDIATTYPNPVDGWTVNVKDTDYTYRYNGNSWIAISANAIPKATNSVDGLLSKEDHTNYNDANSKKHVHSNKSVIDGITDTLVNDWNAAKSHADSSHARIDATNVKSSTTNGNILVNGTETVVYTHPSGTNPHGTTKSDVGLGNVPNVATNNQTPTYTESSTLEKLTSGEKLSVAFGKISKAITDFIAHIGDTVKHISSSERTNWNKAYTHSQSNHAPVNAEENQNAFSNIVVGSTTISADAKSDSLEFSGKNVTITPDSTNDKLTIGITKDNVISALGYTPGSSEDTNTTYKLTKSGSTITLTGSDGSKTSVEDDNTGTTYGVATSSALGLVKSGTDITVDSNGNVSVNDDSHNHVISNIDGLQSALDGKANSSHGNHVPATETANNAKFLRNDNTWQTVTPANIGAAAASHTHSSYVNQNAFSNVKVGETTVSADNTTDTLTLVAGSNVTITPDADNDKITIVAKDTVYTHPTSSGNKHIPSGGSSGQILRWSADGTAAWGSDNNTTYSAGTGLSLSGTTFNHKNSVTAGTAQGDASKTLTFGGTFTIPTVTYDAQGHVTGKGTTTMTMPANPNVDTKVTQTVTTSNASYPLLLAPSGQTSTATTTSYFDSGVTLNPSTNTIAANVSGNSATATKLATARTIALTGSVTGSGTFDGSGNLSIATTTNHTHSYLPLSGGTLTITNYYGLTLKRSDANGAAISYANSSATLGGSGFLSDGYFQISSGSNTNGNIFKANTTSATFPGTVTATSFIGALSGNASTATKLQTSRKIGNASFDGTKNVTLSEMGIINPIEVTKSEYEALKTAGTLDMSAYYNITDDYDSATIIDDTTVSSKFVFSSSKTESTYAKKSTVVDTTLSASSWSGSSAPYTYTLSVSGVTTTNVNEIIFRSSATDAQIEAYQNAILKDGGQSSGKITLKATGDKPTIDIPITIIVRHDV